MPPRPPEPPPFRVVTIASNKGGVGKTTIATNLAIYARALGEEPPVLLLGLDDQAVIDHMLEPEARATEGRAPKGPDLLDAVRSGDLGSAIRLGKYGVHYVPTSPDVGELKAELREPLALRELLAAAGWRGLVVVDTKSDLELLTRSALAASDLAILPVADQTSLDEARKVFALLEAWKRPPACARVLLSLVDRRIRYRTGESADVLALLVAGVRRRGYPLFETFLSRSWKIESLTTNPDEQAHSILHGAPDSLVHRQMRHLVDEVMAALETSTAPVVAAATAVPAAAATAVPAPPELVDVEELLGGPQPTAPAPSAADEESSDPEAPRASEAPVATPQPPVLAAPGAATRSPLRARPVRPEPRVRRMARSPVAAAALVLLVGLGAAALLWGLPRGSVAPEPATRETGSTPRLPGPLAHESTPRSFAQPTAAALRQPFPELAYDARTGRLWGAAHDVELGALLQRIGELAAFEVESRVALSERVTRRFNGDPLGEGLEGLLAGFETALRYEVDTEGNERLRSVHVLGRREHAEPSTEVDRVLRELVDDPVPTRFDAAIRVLTAAGPNPEALELLADLGTRGAGAGADAVRVAQGRAQLRSAMCRAWAGSPEASAALAVLRCRDPLRAQAQ